ncbi:MAG: RNA polymerase sigma factor [Bacteroidales bacterium]
MQLKYSDSEILREFRNDREKGFRLLVTEYRERLYFHIRRIVILHDDADDALQNTFIKAWKSLDSFRSDSSLYTWLYRIATNEALAQLKSRKKNGTIVFDNVDSFFAVSREGDAYFDGDQAEKKLRNAILKLPDKQRLVFQMKYYDDMPYEQISRIVDTSVGALKASYHHAVKKIEEYLEND